MARDRTDADSEIDLLPEVLFLDDVAALLRCSPSTIKRPRWSQGVVRIVARGGRPASASRGSGGVRRWESGHGDGENPRDDAGAGRTERVRRAASAVRRTLAGGNDSCRGGGRLREEYRGDRAVRPWTVDVGLTASAAALGIWGITGVAARVHRVWAGVGGWA